MGGSQIRRAALSYAMSMLVIVALAFVTACTSTPFEAPAAVDDGHLQARAVSRSEDGIRVSAAIPSPQEARSMIGVDLGDHGIQPLWIEIENGSDRTFYFFPSGLDPEYFAPLEVAFLYQGSFSEQGYEALGEHLEALAFDHRSPIVPGATVQGLVYTNPVNPSIMAEIDLVGRQWSRRIGLLVPVPGTEPVQELLPNIRERQASAAFTEVDDEEVLRTMLESLPCCATDIRGDNLPLNLVLIGDIETWGPPFAQRNYRYAPVESWQVFERVQDASARKTSRWVAPQPHTMRVWLAPMRYRGQSVWMAQISSHLGGRFASATAGPSSIEPDVDAARNDVIQDILYTQSVSKIGFVTGSGRKSSELSRAHADAQTYRTDGLRAVLLFGTEPVSLASIDFFDWERMVDHRGLDASDDKRR